MPKVRVTEVKKGRTGRRPIIADFQNAKVGKKKYAKDAHVGVFKKPNKKKIVAISTKTTFYKGKIAKEDESYDNYLLVHNTKTGNVRLIAVDFLKLVSSKICSEEQEPNNTVVDHSTIQDAHNSLSIHLGSKKSKRMAEHTEKRKSKVTHSSMLQETVASVEIDDSHLNLSHVEDSNNLYRPQVHREASRREEVYLLDELVPENVLNSLEADANEILNSNLEEFELHPLVKSNIKKLQEFPDDNSLKKCKILLYINCLITFILKPARMVAGKKFSVCESAPDVNKHILETFSAISNTGRTRPLSMRDKAVCYIMVLCMFAFDYQIDLEALSKDVKLSVKKLQSMARVLGFSYVDSKNKNVMVLKLPLPAAVSVTAKNSKKKS